MYAWQSATQLFSFCPFWTSIYKLSSKSFKTGSKPKEILLAQGMKVYATGCILEGTNVEMLRFSW